MYLVKVLLNCPMAAALLYVLFNVLSSSTAAPITTEAPSHVVETESDALKYLQKFGYMEEEEGSASFIDKETFKKHLRRFQYMAALNQTGEFDEETREMMSKPRCSVGDNVGFNRETLRKRRRKRYVVETAPWPRNDLTYSFSSFSRLGSDTTRRILQTSLKDWSDVAGVTFRETSSTLSANHIEIIFASGDHGDQSAFDGRGGVLAHAYFPGRTSRSGDAHFDMQESWSETSGTNLRQVATHEIGHSLGLGHSNVRDAVMFAFYQGYDRNFGLQGDDIAGIQYLYGRNTRNNPVSPAQTNPPVRTNPPVQTNPPSGTPDICRNAKIDAMVVVEGTTYAFSGDSYYELNQFGIAPGGYPKKINSMWRELNSVDAALYYESRSSGEEPHLFIFKGSYYWRYSNINSLDAGYPKAISVGFPGIPDNLDSALIWSGNGQTYFFKGTEYYRYTRGIGTDYGYPRPLSVWRGLPSTIDAAAQWINKRTYFFKGSQYWRFNDADIAVDSAGGYPRSIGPWWFGCSGNLQSNEMEDAGKSGDQYRKTENKSSTLTAGHHFLYFLYSSVVLLILTRGANLN